MQGAQVKAFTDDTLHIIIDNNGIAVNSAAVEHTVSNGGNLACILDYAMFCIQKGFHDHLDCRLVGRHGFLNDELVLSGRLMCQLGAVDPNPLAEALCHYAFIFHINQLIL